MVLITIVDVAVTGFQTQPLVRQALVPEEHVFGGGEQLSRSCGPPASQLNQMSVPKPLQSGRRPLVNLPRLPAARTAPSQLEAPPSCPKALLHQHCRLCTCFSVILADGLTPLE